MKNNLRKVLFLTGFACAAIVAAAASIQKGKKGKSMYSNPLMQKSTLPFGAPDFSKIKDTDYLPAIKAGIEEQRAEIKAIVNNKEKLSLIHVTSSPKKDETRCDAFNHELGSLPISIWNIVAISHYTYQHHRFDNG